MSKLLLVPALLLAACTETVTTPDAPASTAPGESSESPELPDAGVTPTLAVGLIQEPNACDDNSVRLEALVVENGERVFDVNCRFTLADGRTFDGCFAIPSLPEAQLVKLTVTDPATGATGSYQEVVAGPPSFDATLDVVAHDHAFSFAVTSQFGAAKNVGEVHVDIDRMANVVVAEPNSLDSFAGTVRVTALGTYTVTAHASASYGDLSCGKTVTKTVTVFCDGSAHGAN